MEGEFACAWAPAAMLDSSVAEMNAAQSLALPTCWRRWAWSPSGREKRSGAAVASTDSGVIRPVPWLCCLWATWHWESYLASLGLKFCILKRGSLPILCYRVPVRIDLTTYQAVLFVLKENKQSDFLHFFFNL